MVKSLIGMQIFKRFHAAYVDAVCNPFYSVNSVRSGWCIHIVGYCMAFASVQWKLVELWLLHEHETWQRCPLDPWLMRS